MPATRFARGPAAVLAVAVVAVAQLAVAIPAFAHSYLQSSAPAGGSTSEKPPTEVSITFTEALEPNFSKIEVKDATGVLVNDGPATASGSDNTVLTVKLKPLTAGTYKVIWHVTSTDTHKTHGSFVFDVVNPDE